MAVIDKVAKAAISAIDQFSGMLFGGKLAKAQFEVYEKPDLASKVGTIPFFINPATLTVKKSVVLSKEDTNQSTQENKYSHTNPLCFEIGELWFDTYDERVSVREKYVDALEALLDYAKDTHYLRVVVFNWGQFTGKTTHKTVYKFYVTELQVDYTMFLPDATPVRAKVKVTLEQALTKAEEQRLNPKQSPDHAKLYTVKRGDTLQGIAAAEYDDPREWRRIADTNSINTPMDLRPGMKLLVPPIL